MGSEAPGKDHRVSCGKHSRSKLTTVVVLQLVRFIMTNEEMTIN